MASAGGNEITRLEHKIDFDITRLEHKFELVEQKIDLAVRDVTIRMGAMFAILFAALSAIKFFG